MLLGILGILGGGKDGPYSYAYFLDDIISSTYSNPTPQQSLDRTGYYFTYTLGEALTADGNYSNYYFVEGEINTSYTNLHTAFVAIDYPNIEYLYRDGTAIQAPQHTVKVNLSSVSTSYWLSANPESFSYSYIVNVDFENVEAKYKIYTKSNNLEEASNYPVEPMLSLNDFIEDDEISGELYQGLNPDNYSNIVALWAIREGYFIFAANVFKQFSIHRLEKEGDNFTTKFYNYSYGIGTTPLHTSSANEGNIASNLRGQNYYNGAYTLWHTDNDGYFTGGYNHERVFNIVSPWLYYDSNVPYYNGETLYLQQNTWSIASFLSGYTADPDYISTPQFWTKQLFWSTNGSGVYTQSSVNAPYTPLGAEEGIFFQTDIDVIDGSLGAVAWKYPTGTYTPEIELNASLWLLTGVRQYYNSANGVDTIFEYNVETNPIPNTGYGQMVTFLKFPYSFPVDGGTFTYYFSANNTVAYPHQYHRTNNSADYQWTSTTYGHSDINQDSLIEDWTWDGTTRLISWTQQYHAFDGFNSCTNQNDPNQAVRVLLKVEDGSSLVIGKKIYWDGYTGPNTGTNITGNIGPYAASPTLVFVKDGYYYETDSEGTITNIDVCY